MAAGRFVKRTIFGKVVKRRISDRKPLKKANMPGKDKKVFREMAQREYPEVKGKLSERLAECFMPRVGINAGEQLFDMLNIFKQAYNKSTDEKAAKIKGYIEATQVKLKKWVTAYPGEPFSVRAERNLTRFSG